VTAKGLRSRWVPVVLAASIVGSGCGDLLQEPDTGFGKLPVRLVEVSGNDQTGTAGTELAQPARVRVVDLQGEPNPRIWVEWTVIEGTGEVEPRNSFSDENGIAGTTWILGPEAGQQQIRAFVNKGAPLVFDATSVTQ
jgi:maltoporin